MVKNKVILKGMASPWWVFYFISVFWIFNSAWAQSESFKAQWEKECAEKYQAKVPKMDYAGVGELYYTPEDVDKDNCKGKVGETFCLKESRSRFLATCLAQAEKDHEKEIEKTRKLLQEIKDHDKSSADGGDNP